MGRTRAGVLSIRIGACLATASLLAAPASAAPLFDFPVTVRQPDGTAVDLLASGDEFANRLHDADGFTVLRDPVTGLWVYADRAGDRLAPTRLVAGASDPRELGLVPDLWPSPRPDAFVRRAMRDDRPRAAPLAGTLNNLVVFIRFADEPELTDPISTYETMFNDPVEGHASLYGYYREASYGKLAVRSHFFPQPTGGTVVSFQDSHPRAYYQPYHATVNPDGYQEMSQVLEREANLLSAAVSSVASQIPTDLDLDGDDDGTADNINFVVSGKPDAWADLLWPHMSFITKYTEVNGVIVMYYNFQLHDVLMDGKHLGVLAHEMFHTLGSPDLYHYDRDGFSPAGFWDLMERDLPIPQHMSAYMKRRVAGWVPPIPEITASGEYSLNPLTSPEGNAWRVAAPGSATEYFVLEYRRAAGTYESSLPGSGLVVWRIDGSMESLGNAEGPPDEVYVLRPGGAPLANGNPRDAYLGPHVGRPRLAEDTSPYAFLQDGSRVPFRVYDISEPGDTITFKVCMEAPDCAGRECGDDGCGGSCGVCPAGRTCGDGLCGGEKDCGERQYCRFGCDVGCQLACDHALSGPARRLADAFKYCEVNRCLGLTTGMTLAECIDLQCASEWNACVAGDSAATCADVTECLEYCAGGDADLCALECRWNALPEVLARVSELRTCEYLACPACVRLPASWNAESCKVCRTGSDAGACRQERLACVGNSGTCVPDCAGRVCGPDGCGGTCGACEAGGRCDEGACVPCTCDSRECGGDGCGIPCGMCSEGLACDASGRCVALAASCVAFANAGCAACGGGECAGLCVSACPPGACGDDGCGGECPPCPAATEACSTSFCNAGICATWPARDGWPCDDQDLCSPGDFCSSGACTVTATRPCKSADPCHLDGVCDPATGDCSRPDAPEGTPCDDRDPTLAGATCDGKGGCVVPPPPDGLEDAAEETGDDSGSETGRPDEAIEDVAPEPAPEPAADAVEAPPDTSAAGGGGCNAGPATPGAWVLLAGLLAALLMRRTEVA